MDRKQNRYVHFFYRDSNYFREFKRFVARNYLLEEHGFFLMLGPNPNQLGYFSLSRWLLKVQYLIKIRRAIKSSDRILIHSLPTNHYIFFWLLNIDQLFKCYWIFWGRDVYYYYVKSKTIKKEVIQFVRKLVIPRINTVCGYRSDYEFLIKNYKVPAHYLTTYIPIPRKQFEDIVLPKRGEKDSTDILVGNSADPSNRHIESFQILDRFSNEGIRLVCPLSYRGPSSYIERVVEAGQGTFGSKFVPLMDYLPVDDYNKVLRDIDIGLMNQKRQQGLGNLLSLLYEGKKIFMHTKNTPFLHFIKLGISVYDIETIPTLTFAEFIFFSRDEAAKNRKIIVEVYGEQNLVVLWNKVFNL